MPLRGEFRLGPGLAQPPGISWPMQQTMTRVEPLYAAGEFVLGLGNQAPMGIVVPLYGTAAPRVPAGTGQELIINGSNGGSLRYTGIPYPAAGSNRAGGVNGTRLAQ